MNKFFLLPCITHDDADKYKGHVAPMVCMADNSLFLFFPVSETIAKMVNVIMHVEERDHTDSAQSQIMEVYSTMLDSWESSGNFLSGVLLDYIYDEELKDDAITGELFLSSEEVG